MSEAVQPDMTRSEIGRPTGAPPPPLALVVSSGKRGHDVKGLGIAAALGLAAKLVPAPGWPWSLLAPYARPPLPRGFEPPPRPAIVFASGRRTIPLGRALKRALGADGFLVALDDPGLPPRRFDLVWASLHDGLAGPNVISTLTAPHGLTTAECARAATALAAKLGPGFGADSGAPFVTVLLGGPSGAYRFGRAEGAALGAQLNRLQAGGARLVILPSRRTDPAALYAIASSIDADRYRLLDGSRDPDAYPGAIGLASHFVVSCDSANMIGEAAMTGRPVFAAKLPGGSAKFEAFHRGMTAHGALRWFEGQLADWTYPPLNSTPEIADEIRRRLPPRIADLLPTMAAGPGPTGAERPAPYATSD
ncbi:mitochondrial fission ELM1 family protein [Methylobrevis albus]|uniref:Mitochondrial fission ELM1 family protein n=1 Tax=Methylobrevis albus TaxID=2793297 RepID=A0A931HZ75_9HYPH|nr:mitochondrial fission ELM1 family protein [Methylobrevis albus]MBH0236358.1 mitochondrial fission ELM1 family protein [Methylobrevis albus]